MTELTQQSLLMRAQAGDQDSWQRLVSLYEPFIRRWLRGQSIAEHDADDLTQEVLAILTRELPRFTHRGQAGAFRCWLRTIAVNRAREFWRTARNRVDPPGDFDFVSQFDQLDDPDSDLSKAWDAEHDQHVCRRLLDILEKDFEPITVQAFRRRVFDGASGGEVATELNLTRAAVFKAQSRVLKRLREEAAGLLDD